MIAIIGASGQGKCVYDCFYQNELAVYGFFDDNPALIDKVIINDLKCLGHSQDVEKHDAVSSVFVAIGDNQTRLAKYKYFRAKGYALPNAVHRKAHLSEFAEIGSGVFLMGAAIVNPHSRIGDCCIVNTSATVGHDCELDPGVQVAPGVNVAGGCHIGEGTFIGIGAKLGPGVKVGPWCVVGAGSLVLKDLPPYSFFCGFPSNNICRQIKEER